MTDMQLDLFGGAPARFERTPTRPPAPPAPKPTQMRLFASDAGQFDGQSATVTDSWAPTLAADEAAPPAAPATETPATVTAVDPVTPAPAVSGPTGVDVDGLRVAVKRRVDLVGAPAGERDADNPGDQADAPATEASADRGDTERVERVRVAAMLAAGAQVVTDAPAGTSGRALYLSAKETAVEVRHALRAVFPGVTFSVRSETYSGGSAVRVRWTDGPTADAVEQVTGQYAGATFDGMTDCKGHRGPVAIMTRGACRVVSLGADWVTTAREVSADLVDKVRPMAARYAGHDVDPGETFRDSLAGPLGVWPGAYRSGAELLDWLARTMPVGCRDDRSDAPACGVAGPAGRTCELAAGHPFPLVHRDGYGRPYLGAARAADVARVPAPESPTAPATSATSAADGDRVDAAPAAVRDVIARGRWDVVNVGTKRAPHFCPVMHLPAGRLDRDDYEAVRDTLQRVARGRWDKRARGFVFPAGTDATPWNAGAPSGAEMVAEWLRSTAPADDVEAEAPAPADHVATGGTPVGAPAPDAPTPGGAADAPPVNGAPVPVADLGHGARVRVAGADEYGKPISATGYVQTVGPVRVRPRGSKGAFRSMFAVAVAEHADGAAGWRATVYVDADAVAHTASRAPDDRGAVLGRAPGRRRTRSDVFTLRPTTREQRGCWCPFSPGCSGNPCVAGPRWRIRALIRDRYSWASASQVAVISEDRRAAELARLADALEAARGELRAQRLPGKPATPTQGDDSDNERPPMYGAPAEWYAPELDSDEGADLVITHTHEDGTRFEGGRKGDGTLEILQRHGFAWRRGPGVHIPHSRDRFADLDTIRKAAAALREAGHLVAVEVDDVWRPAAEREEHRAERVAYRAARLAERAGRQAAVSDARRAAARHIADGMPFGEPIKIGHHSERRHRAAFEKIDRNMRAAFEAYDYARSLANRATGAERNERAKHNPRAIMRRVETMEAERRRWERQLAELGESGQEAPRWLRRCTLELEKIREDIAYQRAKLDALGESGEFVAWGPEHFRKGDQVNVGGRWCTVRRVNRKSVSVPWIVGTMSTGQESEHSDTVPWDRIHGRRRDGMQWDAPNAEPWPVEDAKRVAQWAKLVQHRGQAASSHSFDRDAAHVDYARRIVRGLPITATDAELAAFPEPDGTATRRTHALACLAVFERLAAGDRVADIIAEVTPLDGPAPAWRMPAGEPVDKLPRDLVPGDVIAGVWDNSFGGRRLSTSIVGPVAHVGPKVDRRESGEWYAVTLATGEVHEVRSHRWFAVHPADVTP